MQLLVNHICNHFCRTYAWGTPGEFRLHPAQVGAPPGADLRGIRRCRGRCQALGEDVDLHHVRL